MIKGLLIAATLSALVCLALLGFAHSWAKAGDYLVLEAVSTAEAAYDKNGEYPQTLVAPEAKVWGFVAGPALAYRSDKSGCHVLYWQWPFGPYRGQACNSGGWLYEE